MIRASERAPFLLSLLVAGCFASFIACGDDDPAGPGGSSTSTGVFRDSNVSGLGYASGELSGVTDASGTFSYEGSSITFSVGGANLGTATPKSVVTPIDLVTNGSSTNTEVLNIARFLQMLDLDGDPENGIVISSAVTAAASGWSVDFTTNDLPTELASIITDANTADGTTHTLPSAAAAQAHFEGTLLCNYVGAFEGTYSGDDSGDFSVFVDANTGLVFGYAYSTAEDELITLNGTSPISADQIAAFTSGDTSTGSTFDGAFSSTSAVSGNWSGIGGISGGFTGARVGGAPTKMYRFSGLFQGDAIGSFVIDIDASNRVTGIAHTLYAAEEGGIDERVSLVGLITGNTITIDTSDVDGTLTGTIDLVNGLVNGTWSDNEGSGGTFNGAGCRVN